MEGGRFWGGSDSDESENETSEEQFSDDEQDKSEDDDWLSDSGSSDGDVKRVIKDARTKAYERLLSLTSSLETDIGKNEWEKILEDFENLKDWLNNSLVKEDGIPRDYFQTLVKLEDFIQETQTNRADEKITMTKNDSKAFSTTKQRLKKHVTDNQTAFEEFKKNPEGFVEAQAKIDEIKNRASADFEEEEPKGSDSWTTVSGRKGRANKIDLIPDSEWTEEDTESVLNAIKRDRGLKKTDNKEQLRQLRTLVTKRVKTEKRKLEVMMVLISCMFDETSTRKGMRSEPWNDARKALLQVLKLVEKNPGLLKSGGSSVVIPDELTLEAVLNNVNAFTDKLDSEFRKSMQTMDPHTLDYVERLRDESLLLELAKNVQEFFEKEGNKQLAARMAAIRVEHIYYKLDSVAEKIEEAHLGRVEKQKQEGDAQPTVDSTTSADTTSTSAVSSEAATTTADRAETSGKKEDLDTSQLVEKLCVQIYRDGTDRLKTRAMLCHVYHHALSDRYHDARDVILMSHIQDNVLHMDISTQVLYNRTMAQIGLCAFRKGLVIEAHSCLAELCSGGRTRELLAQGLSHASRSSDIELTATEQEKLQEVQVPYHMHINLELLETVHLISAMLLEVPNMAAHPFEVKQRVISRAFQNLVKYFAVHMFTGPPETTRDFVVTAARALAKGDWKRCEDLLLGLEVWALMGVHKQVDQVKAMLRRKIQEEGLRTYLFTYSPYYDSMSIAELSEIFELPTTAVYSLVSKMIINDELHACLDQPTSTIVMQKVEPSRLQVLALQYAEKVASLVENNERLLDGLNGGFGAKFDQSSKDGWRRDDSKRRTTTGNYNNNRRRDGSQNARNVGSKQQQQRRRGGQGGEKRNTNRGWSEGPRKSGSARPWGVTN